jgi:hypothetical protein
MTLDPFVNALTGTADRGKLNLSWLDCFLMLAVVVVSSPLSQSSLPPLFCLHRHRPLLPSMLLSLLLLPSPSPSPLPPF